MDGSKSTDPDGDPLTYLWTQTAGPSVSLYGSDTATASFTAPNLSSDNTLKFLLTVKDDKGATSANPANMTVTVKAAPSFTAPIGNTTSSNPLAKIPIIGKLFGGGNMSSLCTLVLVFNTSSIEIG